MSATAATLRCGLWNLISFLNCEEEKGIFIGRAGVDRKSSLTFSTGASEASTRTLTGASTGADTTSRLVWAPWFPHMLIIVERRVKVSKWKSFGSEGWWADEEICVSGWLREERGRGGRVGYLSEKRCGLRRSGFTQQGAINSFSTIRSLFWSRIYEKSNRLSIPTMKRHGHQNEVTASLKSTRVFTSR